MISSLKLGNTQVITVLVMAHLPRVSRLPSPRVCACLRYSLDAVTPEFLPGVLDCFLELFHGPVALRVPAGTQQPRHHLGPVRNADPPPVPVLLDRLTAERG